ncbi:HERV-H LTR-associating 2 [Labeo rohita]|uniref:HERV-H LTR-associating 2 n=1 Tax=Labeo rohita TaxID=84645 RepID=A0A498NUB2_LABRO|nr:HERV-H LTR-associating 2 [Labeo rohita]
MKINRETLNNTPVTRRKVEKAAQIGEQELFCDCINVKRECVLKALFVYLNEDPDNLIKECMDADFPMLKLHSKKWFLSSDVKVVKLVMNLRMLE